MAIYPDTDIQRIRSAVRKSNQTGYTVIVNLPTGVAGETKYNSHVTTHLDPAAAIGPCSAVSLRQDNRDKQGERGRNSRQGRPLDVFLLSSSLPGDCLNPHH